MVEGSGSRNRSLFDVGAATSEGLFYWVKLLKYLSLCSGIEAASVAWHPLGWEPLAFSEIEPFPSAVLAHNYPNVPNWGDMTKDEEWPDATFDVLVGGTPCQSFSVAGLRKGLTDPRGNLMLIYGAIAKRYRPTWLVWENVPGVLSSNGGRDFGTFLGMLAELGYGFSYRVLDAQYIRVESFSRAVPQRRRRVFVVGYLGSWQRAAAVLFERESLSGDSAPSRKTGKGVASGVAACLRSGGDGGVPSSRGEHLVIAHGQANAEIGIERSPALTCNHEAPIVCFDARQDPVHAEELTMPLGMKDTGHGVQVQWASGGGQLENDTAQSLRSGAEHNYQFVRQQNQVRRLTPIECERLQGFPDQYTNIPWRGKPESPDGPRYKALGNSMAVNCMRWIGERINLF